MRKRRRLADKLTIMVCAVLVSFSAFFYAPMDVEASVVDTYDYSISGQYTRNYGMRYSYFDIFQNFVNVDLEDDAYYMVTFDYDLNFSSSSVFDLNYLFVSYAWKPFIFSSLNQSGLTSYSFSGSNYIILTGRSLCNNGSFAFYLFSDNVFDSPVDFDFSYDVKSITTLTGKESASYQQGYNAGYSAGEQVGESNGYSNGYSEGFEAGEQSGYDSGFQAGQDSVDTQSYYDIGYSAGYDAGYLSGYDDGYDDGYDAGWSAYETQMDKWGADTLDYPLLISSGEKSEGMFSVSVKTSYPLQYATFNEWTSSSDFNPNHIYRFDIDLTPLSYHEGSDRVYFLEEDIFYFNIGGIKYKLSDFENSSVNKFFIPGDRMSTAFSFSWEPYCAMMGDVMTSSSPYCYYDLSFQIYDMGPSGDTQNHIANQTDKLTNGFNDSKGNSVNSDFSVGLNDFETAEDSLFATATTGLKDFTFFDIQSVPAMVTGMSFVGSIMSGWFTQAGGASGVGIVLSILFSIMLVAMVLGLYRWYQSKGGKD